MAEFQLIVLEGWRDAVRHYTAKCRARELFSLGVTKSSSAHAKLMAILDWINLMIVMLGIVCEGVQKHWLMKLGNVSPAYLSKWGELAVVS